MQQQACRTHWMNTALNIPSTKATVHSTALRLTSIWRTPSAEHGSAVPSSWICRCPNALNWNTQHADGTKKRPVMIHRVCFGSIERFIGILIEHFAGQFPVWLSPVQVKVLPISEKFADYAKSVEDALDAAGIRVETDNRAEKIGYKIREARNERVPYIIVVGEKDQEANMVSLRSRKNGEEGQVALADFIARIKEEIDTKVLD